MEFGQGGINRKVQAHRDRVPYTTGKTIFPAYLLYKYSDPDDFLPHRRSGKIFVSFHGCAVAPVMRPGGAFHVHKVFVRRHGFPDAR